MCDTGKLQELTGEEMKRFYLGVNVELSLDIVEMGKFIIYHHPLVLCGGHAQANNAAYNMDDELYHRTYMATIKSKR